MPAQIRSPADIASPAFGRPASGCGRAPCRIVPGRKADRLQLGSEIVIVIARDVGVEAVEAETLEQMRLPQIADVVIDSARFAPARNRPDVAGQRSGSKARRKELDVAFRLLRRPDATIEKMSPRIGMPVKKSPTATKPDRIETLSRPNARSRSAPCRPALPRAAGACPGSCRRQCGTSKKPQATISRLGSGRRSWLKLPDDIDRDMVAAAKHGC